MSRPKPFAPRFSKFIDELLTDRQLEAVHEHRTRAIDKFDGRGRTRSIAA
jgi:hypothetical protein